MSERTGRDYFEALVTWYDETTKDTTTSTYRNNLEVELLDYYGPIGSARANKTIGEIVTGLSDAQKSGLWEFENKVIRAVDKDSQRNLSLLAVDNGAEWALSGLIHLMDLLDSIRMAAFKFVHEMENSND